MLEGLTVAQAGPWAAFIVLSLAVVTAVYRGALIPASWVEQRMQDRDRLDASKDAQIEHLTNYARSLETNNSLYQIIGVETARVVRALPVPDAHVGTGAEDGGN